MTALLRRFGIQGFNLSFRGLGLLVLGSWWEGLRIRVYGHLTTLVKAFGRTTPDVYPYGGVPKSEPECTLVHNTNPHYWDPQKLKPSVALEREKDPEH